MRQFPKIRNSLGFRLIFWVGLILFVSISIWAYYNINYQKKKAVDNKVAEADRLSNTIMLGTHYAMMLYSRDEINQIITNIGSQEGIEAIRIYNKEGEIKYSIEPEEVDQRNNIKAEVCYICHKSEPPLDTVNLEGRKRIFLSPDGHRLLGIVSPVYNEPGCATEPCHVHPEGKKILGVLDAVVSLKETDREIIAYEKGIIAFAVFVFLASAGIIGFFILKFVNRPIQKLIEGMHLIGSGQYDYRVETDRKDEIGRLTQAINHMGQQIEEKQRELNKQRDEYQALFELTPCYITVQDRDFKMLRYNREFARKFSPEPGEYCYQVYKGRSERCVICPVMKTFEDGKSHQSEEQGMKKDGTRSYWLVRTSPILNNDGQVVAAMEMSLDLTQLKHLEDELKKSEEKYRIIFNTIPNPVFVLNAKDLSVIDCNDSVTHVYGFTKGEILQISFLDLFPRSERNSYLSKIRESNRIEHVRQITKDKKTIYVNMRISPSEYLGQEVLLVTTSDITKSLMAEQQLIQASKMATLGEMATGVAHELNQPLSVMKTASSFLMKKVRKAEPIRDEILGTLAEEIDSHVDRASKIINHMREFGRKSEVKREQVNVNEVLNKALEIFSQQLKLREITVEKDLEENLPAVMANSNRLEQVFVNLLINARDAIEQKHELEPYKDHVKLISLRTNSREGSVVIEVMDTGMGIPEGLREKIFEPFFTTKKIGKGTGLGLSISYGIVQDYGGSISVESQEGLGANFIIQFPIAREG